MNTAAKFGVNVHEMIQGILTEEELRSLAAENPQGVEAQVAGMLDEGRIAAQQTGQEVGGGIIAVKRGVDGEADQILYGNDAMKENFDRLRAITVVTENSNPATLLHEWMHWMTSFVIPNSPQYKALLEEAVSKAFGKKMALEDFDREHHEWVTKNFEHYLKTGEAPTAGLRAVFRRIAEALKELFAQWTGNPELKRYFDELLAGPETGNRQAETPSMARVKTDNALQKAYAEMTEAERIAQSDVHTREEKAAMLYAMNREEIPREEQADRINRVIDSSPIIVDTAAIPNNGDIKQLKKNAGKYGKTLKGWYTNKSDNTTFEITIRNKHGGIQEVLSHDHYDKNHLQSIAAIPAIATEAFYIAKKTNEDPQKHPGIKEFRYYLSKISIDQGEGKGNKEFLVKSVISVAEDGKRYYDHRLTEMEKVKGLISSLVMQTQTGLETGPYALNDYRLQQILQEVFQNNFGMLNQIIGELGAAAMDRAEEATARHDVLNIARQMEEAGKNARAVRLATGWERGADGKWRYEIPDIKYKSSTNFLEGKPVYLEDIIDAEALFTAYPELRKYTVWKRSQGNVTATFSAEEKHIDINQNLVYNGKAASGTLTHEVQHAVQNIEGFTRGGSPRGTDKALRDKAVELIEGFNDSQAKALETWRRLRLRLEREIENYFPPSERENYPEVKELRRQMKEADNAFIEAAGKEAFDVLSKIKTSNFDEESAVQLYRSLAGEVEARNAEARTGFTDSQRMETLLADTEDVAREDQIFIRDGVQIAQSFKEVREDLTITDENLTREQAVETLKLLEHKDLINDETGIPAQVNTKQRNKLISNKAAQKSIENGYTQEQHYAAAAKIDKIWKHAVKIEDREDSSGDANIKSIKRFVSPLRYGDETAYANLLAKESVEHGHRIYTVELQEINKLRAIMNTLDNERARPRSLLYNKIAQLAEKVNPGAENNNFGMLNQIIGELGAAAMDRAEEATARHDSLNIARQMQEGGENNGCRFTGTGDKEHPGTAGAVRGDGGGVQGPQRGKQLIAGRAWTGEREGSLVRGKDG